MDGQPDEGFNGGANSERELEQDRPHSARMYDYYLGGKTNYLVDREAAQEVISLFPSIPAAARANRSFMHRAVHYLASERDVRQFIDIGTGIPTTPNLHEVAQRVDPGCRVVYVDNDPLVLMYADELLDGTPEGKTHYVEADANSPEKVLRAVRATESLNWEEPIGLSLHALLHFVPDAADPYGVVGALVAELPQGSYLSLTHCTGDFDPESWAAVIDVYISSGTPTQVRSKDEVQQFFQNLEMVDPGLVVAHRWRPETGSGPSLHSDAAVSLYGGVASKT
ncbi:SAM-dependent methyltransferase [Streptomyces lydicus]|uniref:SAM-dependent methyltransferase n=1 Tax=Streptomyces lydicus TaxID=47763 RepID=UPI0036B1186B